MIYNLDGVDNLQLSPETLAKIFKQEIKTWDDPAIKADNPDATLPEHRITVVNRSDESGTTQNFTEYLAAAAPDVGPSSPRQDWPVKGGEAAQGTSGVVDAVKAGKGAIGYADESRRASSARPTSRSATRSSGRRPRRRPRSSSCRKETDDPGAHVFTYDLDRTTTEAGAYPIVLVSYAMACTTYDDAAQAAPGQGLPQLRHQRRGSAGRRAERRLGAAQ